MKIFFTIVSVIAFILASCGYGLWVYHEAGFHFTVRCLISWSLCLVSWLVCTYLLVLFIEEKILD